MPFIATTGIAQGTKARLKITLKTKEHEKTLYTENIHDDMTQPINSWGRKINVVTKLLNNDFVCKLLKNKIQLGISIYTLVMIKLHWLIDSFEVRCAVTAMLPVVTLSSLVFKLM